MRSLKKLIERAQRLGHVENGFVTCDICDTPADRDLSLALHWTGCAPCITGEAASLDPEQFIHAKPAVRK
jgi:hypothetical protein